MVVIYKTEDTVALLAHVAHNRRLSASDTFSPTRNTAFGLGVQEDSSAMMTGVVFLSVLQYWDVSTISAKEWKATHMQAEKNTKQLHSVQHRQCTHSLAVNAPHTEVLYMSSN